MAAINTETIDIQNAIRTYERDNADKIHQHLERLLADISKGKMPIEVYVANVRADIANGRLNNFLGHKPEDDIVVELGKSLYDKYHTEFTRKHLMMVANSNPFGAPLLGSLPEIPKASKLMQPTGTGTARADPRFTAPTPNPGHKEGRDDRIECKCGDVCDQWKREPRKGEPQHQATMSKVIAQFRIMYETLQGREHELQVYAAQIKDLTAKLQESNRAVQDVDRIRQELKNAVEGNKYLQGRTGELEVTIENLNNEKKNLEAKLAEFTEEKNDLNERIKRLDKVVENNLANTDERAFHLINNVSEVNASKGRFTNISFENASGTRLHITSAGSAEADRVESIANHHQTAYTMRTVAAAASPEAVAAFLTPDVAKYYRPLPTKALENKKQDSRVEEVVEEKKVLRIENQSAKKQQELPISEIVARENIEPEARFLKNPKEFADFRGLAKVSDPYWPENYLSFLDPEFSVGWAKRHQDRPKCAEYLAKF